MTEEEIYTDYPSRVCNICWNDLKEFRAALNEIVAEFTAKKAVLYSKWKQASFEVQTPESLEVDSDKCHVWRSHTKLCTG